VSVVRPRGAFYIFPRIDAGMGSADLARALLEEERVAVVPRGSVRRGGRGPRQDIPRREHGLDSEGTGRDREVPRQAPRRGAPTPAE
jgi:aromatic amino acid aminotransferase apoenzyme (EC 2.6.1.57)